METSTRIGLAIAATLVVVGVVALVNDSTEKKVAAILDQARQQIRMDKHLENQRLAEESQS